jgi:hypothetical protein
MEVLNCHLFIFSRKLALRSCIVVSLVSAPLERSSSVHAFEQLGRDQTVSPTELQSEYLWLKKHPAPQSQDKQRFGGMHGSERERASRESTSS